MAYESLKDKFLKNEDYLYGKYPLTGDEKIGWYVEIRPNTSTLLQAGDPFLDTQAVPLVSAARDAKRVTRFLLSGRGLLFLGKQALLQTGNTFGQTRLLNPLFVIKQLVPFVHFPRHASNVPLIISSMLPPTDASAKPPGGDQINRLQKETVDRIREKVKVGTRISTQQKISFSNIIPQIMSPFKAVVNSIGGSTVGKNQRPEIKFEGNSDYWEIVKTNRMIDVVKQSANARELVRAETAAAINKVKNLKKFEFTGLLTRPELGVTIPANPVVGLLAPVTVSKVDFVAAALTSLNTSFQETLTKYINDPKSKGLTLGSPNQTLSSFRQTITSRKQQSDYSATQKMTQKTRDDINSSTFTTGEEKTDFIIFTFEAGGEKVQLRSFIAEFGVTAKADYTENRYIGRYEKFITYEGVLRNINLSYFLLPQNADELPIIWQKLDWLTRLTFPTRIQSAGYFEPPLAKLTIGGVFDRISVYVNNVDWKLDENSIWDIDEQVPQYIKVNMALTVIESALNTLQNGALYKINQIAPKVKQTTYED